MKKTFRLSCCRLNFVTHLQGIIQHSRDAFHSMKERQFYISETKQRYIYCYQLLQTINTTTIRTKHVRHIYL